MFDAAVLTAGRAADAGALAVASEAVGPLTTSRITKAARAIRASMGQSFPGISSISTDNRALSNK